MCVCVCVCGGWRVGRAYRLIIMDKLHVAHIEALHTFTGLISFLYCP